MKTSTEELDALMEKYGGWVQETDAQADAAELAYWTDLAEASYLGQLAEDAVSLREMTETCDLADR